MSLASAVHLRLCSGIISPVSDSYGKPGLVPIQQRLEMLREALPENHWMRIDTWESEQVTWTRTKLVLDHHHAEVKKRFGEDTGLRLLSGKRAVLQRNLIFICDCNSRR